MPRHDAPDPRLDDVLLRHVRLVKPHLAPRGFKLDKWKTVAAAVNSELGRKVWGSGNGAQGRFGHLLTQYRDRDRSRALPESVRARLRDYLKLMALRKAQAQEREQTEQQADDEEEDEEDGEEEDEEDEHEQGEGHAEPAHRRHRRPAHEGGPAADNEDHEDEETIEEVEFKRERGPAMVDLTGGGALVRQQPQPQQSAGVSGAASVALFHETVTALRDMTSTLLHVIEQDHATRREEAQLHRADRKELLEFVRLALQARE